MIISALSFFLSLSYRYRFRRPSVWRRLGQSARFESARSSVTTKGAKRTDVQFTLFLFAGRNLCNFPGRAIVRMYTHTHTIYVQKFTKHFADNLREIFFNSDILLSSTMLRSHFTQKHVCINIDGAIPFTDHFCILSRLFSREASAILPPRKVLTQLIRKRGGGGGEACARLLFSLLLLLLLRESASEVILRVLRSLRLLLLRESIIFMPLPVSLSLSLLRFEW